MITLSKSGSSKGHAINRKELGLRNLRAIQVRILHSFARQKRYLELQLELKFDKIRGIIYGYIRNLV